MSFSRKQTTFIGATALNMFTAAFALKTMLTQLEPGWVQGTLYLTTFVCDVVAIIYLCLHPERD